MATPSLAAASSTQPAPTRRRRWHQFSLRTLTLFMVACSLLLGAFGWRLRRAQSQAQTVAALRALGCQVQYEYDFERTGDGGFTWAQKKGSSIPEVFVKSLGEDFFYDVHAVNANRIVPKSPADVQLFWKLVAKLPEMHHFQLQGDWLDHDGFSALRGNQSLQHLWFTSKHVSDKDLAVAGTMPHLRVLHVTGFGAVVTDEGIAALDDLEDLESFQLYQGKISDEAARHLAKHPKLRALQLSMNSLTDESTKWLAKLPELMQLSLSGTQISDAGLANLSELKKLSFLSLSNTKITDDGLIHLGDMLSLEALSVQQTGVHGPGLRHLAGLPRLQSVDMNFNSTTDADLAFFSPLLHIETLALMGSKVTDDGMVAFELPPAVKEVSLAGSSIGDRTLERLSSYPRLRHVMVWNTKVSPQGVAAFKKALPACTITP